MTWRLARALEQLRMQVNQQFPQRSKDSDGSIGDEHHSARLSDHNPDGAGVVHAIDITHDPRGGFDSYAFADMLLKRQDRRVKYVISNRRIGSGPAGPAPGLWRPYTGQNAHDHHCHISVMSGELADDVSAWSIDGLPAPSREAVAAYVVPPETLRQGARGAQVEIMQRRLNARGGTLNPDGIFGPATTAALRHFQEAQGLAADGICGPASWRALT